MNTFLWCFGTFVLTVPYCSAFEWTLHRYVMHKEVRFWFFGWRVFRYPFQAHACIHHHVFKADESYHLMETEDKKLIPMAWWNCIILTLIGSILPFAIGSWLGHRWAVTLTAAFTIIVYYAIYESIHWCMHLPRPEKKRLVERIVPFRWLNGHHILHHRYMHKNFNVVLPLFDKWMGTLLLRSKLRVPQPTPCALVPDVQPPKGEKHLQIPQDEFSTTV